MASIQLMKQQNIQDEARNVTTVSQKQSLELVQTTFLGAVSILTYMRELLPEKAYVKRWYDTRDEVLPYEDFAAGRMPSRAEDAKGAKTTLQLLQRDRSKRTDVFLDWLDTAFNEINSGTLRAMQLLILANPKRRDEVLEAYTFTVEYTGGEGKSRTASGFKIHTSDGEAATVCSTTSALQDFLRGMTDLCQELPILPKKRYLSIEFLYNKTSAKQRKPSGFIAGSNHDLLFARAKGWERQIEPFAVNSGYHGTTLSISYIQQEKDSEDLVNDAQALPRDVDFRDRVARFDNVAHSPKTQQVPTAATGNLQNLSRTEENRTTNNPTSPQHATAGSAPRTSSHTLGRATSQQADTQSSIIPEMRAAFEGMMQPENLSRGDTQTQGPLRQDSLRGGTQPSPVTASAGRATAAGDAQLAFSPATQNEISSQKPFLRMTSASLVQKIGGKNRKGQTVLCICGHAKQEGDLAECHGCGTWQHLHCHGYIGSEDPRLPPKHACYSCLLGRSDMETHRKLQELATRRRAMFWVLHNGMRTKSDFSRDLDLSPKVASPIHTHLKKSDYLVGTSMSHKPGYRATGQPLFVPVKEGPAFEDMFKVFFDPTALVEKHYEGITEGAIAQAAASLQRLIGSRADSMPPPATPYPGRKKKVEGTPSSGLDLPTPQANFETPTLPRRYLSRGVKRSLDNDEADAGVSKKVATPATNVRQFSSWMSEQVIDAYGTSSPVEASGSKKRAKR